MNQKTRIVLCWHMHQPYYRDALDGGYRLPWVYLHAIKDYADMAAHLEAFPTARVVVNFAPVLLEQLDHYGSQMREWLERGSPMQDPLLNLVAGVTGVPADAEARAEIISACQRAHAPTMIDRYAPYRSMVEFARQQYIDGELDILRIGYLNTQFFIDLLVWYHLAWLGSSIKQNDPRVCRLLQREKGFTREDQRLLVEVMAEVVEGILPRYRSLMEAGQIELSMTPYGHPIVPLLIDFKAMNDAQPTAPIPLYPEYPGGEGRARWHMERGLAVFEDHFGVRPVGVWLSEGGISSAALKLLDEFEIAWTASGEGVWRASCEASKIPAARMEHKKALYHRMTHDGCRCALFFRDDGLSDLIGFQYKNWQAEDAAEDFCRHLETIGSFLEDDPGDRVITVILDGENAWEYYPDNGYYFLQALYRKLTEHPDIVMSTFSDVVSAADPAEQHLLPVLKAGSWVYGSFSTWIGDKDKNSAWNLLVEAKICFDRVAASGVLSQEKLARASEQLAVCEGSDWFWWFGDFNPSDSVRDFDQLFRRHLVRLYQLLEKIPPQKLKNPLSRGGGDVENAGTMRRN
ncbi:MAG: glycoside hydrolase family 57 protein [Desulfuromonadales bacterium]|nr:glycoside hydrolase family 57 protein [Desulfuromonadales bacterium]